MCILSYFLAIASAVDYNIIAVKSFQLEGGGIMQYIESFLISVVAGVVCYYIGKWLDRK